MERPLLRAIQQAKPPVLLIDEIDRADEEFEAYLLSSCLTFKSPFRKLARYTQPASQ